MRFVKFALVGMGNTAIAFAVFNVLVRWPGLPALVASGLAWVAGFGNSFVWNRSWTFADRGRLPFGRVLSRFLASNLVALAADETVVAVLTRTYGHSLHGVSLNLVELPAIAAALCVNYVLSTRWVFREPVPSSGVDY